MCVYVCAYVGISAVVINIPLQYRQYLLVDPTHSEEAVMDGRLVVGVNIHREICALQMAGGVAILPEQVSGGN